MIKPILNSKNEIIEYIAVRHEITELVQQREELGSLVNRYSWIGNRFKLGNDIYKHQKTLILLFKCR